MDTRPPADFAGRFNVSRETMEKLQDYVALLLKWQARINIIGPSTAAQVWERHIADSLQLTPVIAERFGSKTISLLDLGTGAGLPGIPLTLHLSETGDVFVHLVDSNAKKAAFLREATRITGVSAQVHCCRIEGLGHDYFEPAPHVVVSRALAPLDQLTEWALPWLTNGGVGVFQKGRNVEKELSDTDPSRPVDYKVVQSQTNLDSSLVIVEAQL